jgi:hypothetical protein
MNKFRVNKPLSTINTNQEMEVKKFGAGAELREQNQVSLNMEAKPLKSFTIPFNDYELDLLRRAAKKDNRSQRYIARLLLVKAMEQYLNEVG